LVLSRVSAQDDKIGSIKGSVTDESNRRPVEFVNVVLRRAVDSAIVAGAVTGKSGVIELKDVPSGEYFLAFSLIGYKEKTTPPFKIDSLHRHLNFGEVALVATPVNLDEVLVTADKSIFNNSIDRKVYNVDQDLMSKAGSASELLQNVPSVQVDLDGNVSLRGSSNVLIMVNGKSSAVMDRSSAEVLQQMPASSIERIELITNPSAKYKPDGTSGIINIVLKKNGALGINGNVSGNAGNNGRFNGNLRLNYNPEDFNIFASYGIRKDNRNRTTSDARSQVDSASVLTHYKGDLLSLASPLSNMPAFGFDLHLSGRDETGFSANYFVNTFTRTDHLAVGLSNAAWTATEGYYRDRYDPEYEKEYGFTAYAQHEFSKEEHKLRLEVTASRSPEQEDNHFTNVYLLPAPATSFDNTLIKQDERRTQVSLDYSNPFDGNSTLEAGYAGEFSNSDLNFYAESFNPDQQEFVRDSIRTNQFLYDGETHALYGTWRRSFGGLGVQGGLRAEEALIQSHLVTRDSTVSNDYFNFYPTLHLSYKLNPVAEIQLSYSKRVNRPRGEDLNPFPEYRDPRNVSAGNPYLLPEYIHSIELGCQLQNDLFSILPALYYRYTYNRFTSVTRALDDTTLLTTRQNLSNGQSGGVEIVVSANVGNLFSAHWSANAYHDEIDASNLGYTQNNSATTWSSNLTLNFNVGGGSRLQMNSNYNSARLTPQGEYVPSYVVNMGFRQELFEGKVALVTTVSDLFASQKRQLELTTPLLNQTVINTRDSRIVYVGFTYRFGAPPKKSKEEQLRYENGE
jgi:outer membrane receptor protein involved in Fe transport